MKMKAYKGFDKDLKCGGFQFEIGKEYEEKKAKLCQSGFHACEYPIDMFGYYPPSDSKFCEVELESVSNERESDSKICGKKIKIGAEIGFEAIVDASIKFIFEKIDRKNQASTNTGDRSIATNTGDQSAATNTGDQSAATNTGNCSAATNTGDRSAATVEGKDSVAISTGYEGRAKGKKGCFLVLAQWAKDEHGYHLSEVKSAKVDGDTIKEDVFYTLKNGEFTEVSE